MSRSRRRRTRSFNLPWDTCDNLGIPWVSTPNQSSATLDGMTRLFVPAQPIAVKLNERGRPIQFVWNGVAYKVERVVSDTEVDTEWWVKRVWRRSVTVLTEEKMCLLYNDLETGTWFVSKLYD